MTCKPVETGDRFVSTTLSWLECSGRSVGESGYNALAAPDSILSGLIVAFLTLFIAFQGLRLMFNRPMDMGDAALAAAKVGLFLMLATSWPATRVLAFDTVFRGPGELAAAVTGSDSSLRHQLEKVDRDIVAFTTWGSGKADIRAGQTADGDPAAAAFAGEPLQGGTPIGIARVVFLFTALGSLGFLALASGCLIAFLPLFAATLLFDRTRPVFEGWARGVVLLLVGGAAVQVILLLEISMLGPWLAQVVEQRASSLAVPSAPLEFIAMTSMFALIVIGSLIFLSRVIFSLQPQQFIERLMREPKAVPATAGNDRSVRTSETRTSTNDNERVTRMASQLRVLSQRTSRTDQVADRGAHSSNRGGASAAEASPRSTPNDPRRAARTSLSNRKRDQR